MLNQDYYLAAYPLHDGPVSLPANNKCTNDRKVVKTTIKVVIFLLMSLVAFIGVVRGMGQTSKLVQNSATRYNSGLLWGRSCSVLRVAGILHKNADSRFVDGSRLLHLRPGDNG